MKARFVLGWIVILAGLGAFGAWISFGDNYVRRQYFGVPAIQDAERTESQFVAVLLPRITAQPHRYAMSASELAEFLGGLKAAGYVSIGMSDVAQFYRGERSLPPKAVLIAFGQDDPQGVEVADEAMKFLRLRGVAFVSRVAAFGSEDQRRFLTKHAVDQMAQSGAWDIGRIRQTGEQTVLWSDSFPLRFVNSEMGLNGKRSDPLALNILAIRPDLGANENLRIVRNSWPRTAQFSDDFAADGLGADWVAGWGVVSRGNRRLAILPTPRQSGAGVFLRGTDNWRDLALEFELKRYQKEFWAYARYKDDDSFVRVGARNGFWYVEQKSGQKSLPSLLARSPILEGALPARVRLVLKGGTAIVHINGRMQFGRVLQVNPGIDRGRILLGVYDALARSAMAVLTSVRAAPLGQEWISFKGDDMRLDGLREAAVHARAMSPLWVKIAADGGVSVAQTQGDLIRSLAGFYGCRLVPMADFPVFGVSALGNSVVTNKLIGDLAGAAGQMDAQGLNLHLRGGQARRPETIAFLAKLHAVFHARHRELWVTVDGARGLEPAMGRSVDGMLEPSKRIKPDYELLEALN